MDCIDQAGYEGDDAMEVENVIDACGHVALPGEYPENELDRKFLDYLTSREQE